MLKIPVNSLVLAAADVATASLPWQAGLRYGLLGLPLAFAALALYVVLLVSYIGVIRYMAEHPKQPAPEAPLPIATTGA